MHEIKKDLTGKKFARLTVIELDLNKTEKSGRTYWICKCECDSGIIKSVRGDSLTCGTVKSCGCLKKEQDKTNLGHTTHGLSKTRFYNIYLSMMARCHNANTQKYKVYGARGIKVCNEWLEFENFHKDMYDSYLEHIEQYGEKDTTIDRIDVDGNYEPENCRWATIKEQGLNKQNTLYYSINGVTKPFREWCDIFNIDYKKAHSRLKRYNIDDTDKIFYNGDLQNFSN